MSNAVLALDCEWNGYGGDLISMALVEVGPRSRMFYEVLACDKPEGWVRENVIPRLGKNPVSLYDMRVKLEMFLVMWDKVEIVADWPEDIARFCDLVITGPGTRIKLPELSFRIVFEDAESANPHNALADANAIADFVRRKMWAGQWWAPRG